MAEVTMPQLGETVTEGTITKWLKAVGDTVAEDELLFEVSTEKVDSEVPSTTSGVLSEIRVQEGETVDVGTVLAVIAADAAAAPAAPAAAPSTASPAAAAAPGAEPAPAPAATPEPAPVAVAAHEPSMAARSGGAIDDDGAGSNGQSQLLSPVVRRLVNEHGLDAATIDGTGVGGRITRNDVMRVIESGIDRSAPAAPPAPTQAPAAPPPVRAPVAPVARAAPGAAAVVGERDEFVPFNRIRQLTGDHMVMSKATSAHVLTAVEVDYEGVEVVRRSHRASWKAEEGFSLTYLPFITRAVTDALRDYPHINASVGDGGLVVHRDINIAVAVDLGFDGLLAPVLRHVDGKRLRAIAREIVDLAGRARSKRLSPDDLVGGTFTLTNPGQYGTMMQFPVINQPQVAILSTDGVKRRPVVIEDAAGNEAIAIHSVGVLALAWDHRAFDGAYVAAFLDRVREIIETREWEAEIA